VAFAVAGSCASRRLATGSCRSAPATGRGRWRVRWLVRGYAALVRVQGRRLAGCKPAARLSAVLLDLAEVRLVPALMMSHMAR
jgi:hypothetical protein